MLTEPQGLVGHHQTDQHMLCAGTRRRTERERGRENIWNNGWKFPTFDETSRKFSELKERWTQRKMNSETQTVRCQRERTSKAAGERNHHIWGILDNNNRFLIRSFGGQWADIFKVVKEGKKNKTFRPRVLYSAKLSFKSEGELKAFPSKQKLRSWWALGLPCTWNDRTPDKTSKPYGEYRSQ